MQLCHCFLKHLAGQLKSALNDGTSFCRLCRAGAEYICYWLASYSTRCVGVRPTLSYKLYAKRGSWLHGYQSCFCTAATPLSSSRASSICEFLSSLFPLPGQSMYSYAIYIITALFCCVGRREGRKEEGRKGDTVVYFLPSPPPLLAVTAPPK